MDKGFFEEVYDDPDDDPLRFDSVYEQPTGASRASDSTSSAEPRPGQDASEADEQHTTVCIRNDASKSDLRKFCESIRNGWDVVDIAPQVRGDEAKRENLQYVISMSRRQPTSLFDF